MSKALALFLLVLFAAPTVAVQAHDHGGKGIAVRDAWTPEQTDDPGPMPVYMIIHSSQGQADRLIGARASIGGRLELRGADQSPSKTLEVVAASELVLAKGGAHLLLLGISQPLKAHEGFKVSLEFEHSGRILVDVFVGDPAVHDHSIHSQHRH